MQTVQIDRKTWIQIPDGADPEERKARWLARMAEAREKSPARGPMTGVARRKAVVYDEWKENAELTAASRAEEVEAGRKRKAEAEAKKEAEANARAERRKEKDRERGRKQMAKAKAEREKAKKAKPEYKPKRRIDWKAWYAWMKVNEPEKYRANLERMKRYRMSHKPGKELTEEQKRYRMSHKPGKELTEEQKRKQNSLRTLEWLARVKETDPERYADILEKRRQYKKAYSQRRKAERAAQATEQ